MNTVKVSVIIPIYNTANYLRQCLDSILAQTLQEIEIICVDDGSTDESPAILNEYAAKDSRIRLLHQENRFAGTARNYGMTVATGKYYAFWDSDDFFKPKALELMYERSERDRADICICSANQYFDDIGKSLPSTGYIIKKYLPGKLPFSQKDIPDHILNFATAHPWNKLFRREFIEQMGLRFHETPNGNDIFFVINCIARAERITIVNKPLVCYRVNQPRSQYGAANKTPLTPINNWLLTRESLIANNAYPKRSFDNKIIGTLIYFLHNMRSWDAFRSTFLYIQTEVLPQMEITMQEEGYYYNAANAVCLEHMLSDSPEEFLVFFSHTTYKQLTEKSGRLQTLSHKNKKLQSALSKSRRQETALSKKMEDITNSRSYRLGRFLTALPRKIRGLFQHR
jgi:glycosyltransferase involved in cell wall biosynthesis